MARGASAGTKNAAQELGLEGGLLCQLVHSPDYRLFPNSAVFESNFIQVTKKGKFVDITNAPTIVTMGVTSSDPCLPLPNVLLMARCRTSPQRDPGEVSNHPSIALTRLLPLRYIRLSVHNAAQHILRILTVTKKVYYLQLHPEHPQAVFALWGRLADILQKGLSITTKDPNIRIRHSLVPSGSSPSSSSSSAEHSEPGALQQSSAMKKVGRKMPGVFSHIAAKPSRRGKGQRKTPFEGDIRKTVSALSNEIRVLFCDMPPPLVCAKCKGRLPPEVAMRSSGEPGPSESDLDLLRWVDGSSHGLWQQEAPSWLQPLCRLSSLAAAGWK